MAQVYRSTADVITFSDRDLVPTVSDVLDDTPLIGALHAASARGSTYTYTKKTANPVTGFRSANDGLENTDSTTAKTTLSLQIVDGSFHIDKQVAEAREDGWAVEVAEEADAHLKSMMAVVEKQIIYGTVHGASAGFSGFADQANLNQLADAETYNVGGTTSSTASSVWLVKSGPLDCSVIWGQMGVIDLGETIVSERAGSSTGFFPTYYTPMGGWCGLKIGNIRSVVRIVNVTEDSGKTLTDDHLSEAMALGPANGGYDFILMGKRSRKQLQQSRTATNATGAPAPIPVEAFGMPIVTSDQVIVTETLIA